MEKNTTSTKGMPDGTEYEVNIYAPTFGEWVKHFCNGNVPDAVATFITWLATFGVPGLARWAADYNQHKIANNLASRLKSAVAQQTGKSTVENPKASTVAENVELYRKLKAGEVFDLRDFVSPEGRQPGESDAIVKVIRDKWATSTTEKRAAFLAKFDLSADLLAATPTEVEAAYRSSGSLL